VGGVVACAWSGAISGLRRDSVAAEVTWLVSVGAVVAVDVCLWRGRRAMPWGWRLEPAAHPWPRPGRGGWRRALLGVAPWLVLVTVAAAWDVLGLATPSTQPHLTISALSQAYRTLNAVVLLIWIGAGVGYGVARARAPVADDEACPARHGRNPPEGGPIGGLAGGGLAGGGLAHLGAHRVVVGTSVVGLLLPEVPAAGLAFWVAVPVVAVVLDQVARRSSGRLADAEELVRFLSTGAVAKAALVATWLFIGYHLFAR
jgi:hypothetical protein